VSRACGEPERSLLARLHALRLGGLALALQATRGALQTSNFGPSLMSALPPKADMCSATRDVRFVPIADIQSLALEWQNDQTPMNYCSSFGSGTYWEQEGVQFLMKFPLLLHAPRAKIVEEAALE
jgi:hypothetical protein